MNGVIRVLPKSSDLEVIVTPTLPTNMSLISLLSNSKTQINNLEVSLVPGPLSLPLPLLHMSPPQTLSAFNTTPTVEFWAQSNLNVCICSILLEGHSPIC
jgi:hypothetical protein